VEIILGWGVLLNRFTTFDINGRNDGFGNNESVDAVVAGAAFTLPLKARSVVTPIADMWPSVLPTLGSCDNTDPIAGLRWGNGSGEVTRQGL
jgi:hypothetical protein